MQSMILAAHTCAKSTCRACPSEEEQLEQLSTRRRKNPLAVLSIVTHLVTWSFVAHLVTYPKSGPRCSDPHFFCPSRLVCALCTARAMHGCDFRAGAAEVSSTCPSHTYVASSLVTFLWNKIRAVPRVTYRQTIIVTLHFPRHGVLLCRYLILLCV